MHNATWKKTICILSAVLTLLLPLALAGAAGQDGTITGNQVNLRSGPSLAYGRVAYLYKGDAVTVTGEENGWYAVTSERGNGFVYSQYVALTGDSGGASDGGEAPSTETSGSLSLGSRGDRVKQLQGNLIMLGYLNDRADGIFGKNTEAAVRRYQSKNNLSADGVAGSKTISKVGGEVLRILSVVDTAKRYLGLPYAYGGTSPATGFDCSGLTQYAFAKAGVTIPRVSYEQAASGISVPRAQIRIGDLVAFHSPVSHVGIYVGNGRFIHSPKTGDVVKYTNLSAMNLTAIRRFTGVLAG